MRSVFRLIACVALFPMALPSNAGGTLSRDARVQLSSATALGAKGKKSAAMAVLESLLLGTVRIAPAPGQPEMLSPVVSRAVAVWGNSLQDSPFVVASDKDRIDVKVRFVDAIIAGPDAQGRMDVRRDYYAGKGHGFRITATVSIRRTYNGRPLTEDQATGVLVHELGHLLGLDDEGVKDGVMGPFHPQKVILEPTREEVVAIEKYRQAVRQSIARLIG
jgi:hypothetical protein